MINYKEPVWTWENTEILGLMLLNVFVIYFLPKYFGILLYVVILLQMIRSEKDYFWIVFYFILSNAPGRLFETVSAIDSSDMYRQALPVFKIAPGVVITMFDALIITFLLKAIVKGKAYHFIFSRDMKFLLFYLVVVVGYTLLLGIPVNNLIDLIRAFLPWSLLYIIPKLLSPEDMVKLDRLLFPITLIVFLSQLTEFTTGFRWSILIVGTELSKEGSFEIGEDAMSRGGTSEFILLYCFIKALFYLFGKEKTFPEKYLVAVILVSVISIFLSGTRGWIIASAVVLVITLFQQRSNKIFSRILYLVVAGAFFLYILQMIFPKIGFQITNVFKRLESVEAVAAGDLSGGGTLSRLTERAPKVMRVFYERPLFGYGFSKTFISNWDMHVGTPTLLLNLGVVGFIIVMFFFFKWLYYLFKISKMRAVRNIYGSSVLVFTSALFFILVVHLTSHLFWGFYLGKPSIIVISLFFMSVNFIYYHSVKTNVLSSKNNEGQKKKVIYTSWENKETVSGAGNES